MSTDKCGYDAASRQSVTKTLAAATAVFILLLGLLLGGARLLPWAARTAVISSLERGDYAKARAYTRYVAEADRAGYLEQCDYMEAVQLMERGAYDAAAALFLTLGDYSDADIQARESLYRKAGALLEAGETEAAAELFRSLVPYADAAERYKACLYRQAEEYCAAGDIPEAALLFDSLGDYADAGQQALTLAISLTGEEDGEAALAALRGLSPEALARRAELAAAREDRKKDIIAVGFYHTLGLRADGSVLACGDNSDGQCEVGDWRNITAVAAGASHSVGLRADGTVVAVGRNSEGQCQVSQWTDIVQIAAADYATLGLRADGTLVSTGFNSYEGLAAYGGIRSITAGSYAAAVLLSDGSAVISHETARGEELVDLVDIAVNTAYAVGLKADGTVVSPALALEDWQDVIAVSTGSNGVLGLTLDGRVLAVWFRPGFGPTFSEITDAVAVATGGTHWAILHGDGSVSVFGDGSRGQADTAGWNLF